MLSNHILYIEELCSKFNAVLPTNRITKSTQKDEGHVVSQEIEFMAWASPVPARGHQQYAGCIETGHQSRYCANKKRTAKANISKEPGDAER